MVKFVGGGGAERYSVIFRVVSFGYAVCDGNRGLDISAKRFGEFFDCGIAFVRVKKIIFDDDFRRRGI